MQAQLFTATALKKLFEDRIIKSKAVGLDGTRLEHFTVRIDSEVELISRKVISSSYNFTNYREKLISKGAGKYPRQISIPTVRDRLTMRALCNALSDIAPTSRNKPPHSIISSVVKEIRSSNEHVSFLRIDIMDFFPSIRHNILLDELKSIGCQLFLIELVKAAIKNPTGMRALTKVNELGVPQGLSISNILSSIYLRRFDELHAQSCAYFRYVDDILIVLPSHLASGKFKTIYADLERIGLRPHMLGVSGKSEINRVSTGVDYLGYHITEAKVSVRQSSYRRMFVNLNKVLTLFKYKRKVEAFLFKINLRITGCIVDGKRKGWLMFFSQTENISQLAYLDNFLKRQMARMGIMDLYPKIATFVKTYHEIRYKGDQSTYIPNFDSYDLEQKYIMIASLTNSSLEELQSRSIEATEYEFKSLVAREVADLEQDMLEASS